MALFENEIFRPDKPLKTGNPYLDNASKGLALLKKVLTSENKSRKNDSINKIIKYELIPIIAKADIIGEIRMIKELNKLLSKSYNSETDLLFSEKNVIGIGGRFSSGKSSFINSLIDKENPILPEGQLPTTSVSTYIINGSKWKNTISTFRDSNIIVDNDAVIALTHQFYENYSIGFSKYINNIILQTPKFGYSNIALLDTPGYNKNDSDKKQAASDREKARTQLKNVDYIIWLVDSDSVIKSEDLEFLQMLDIQNPILIVMNKADKRIKENLQDIINSSRDSVNNAGIELYDVIGYDSHNGREILSEGIIEHFLNDINTHKKEMYTCNETYSLLCTNVIEQLEKAEVQEILSSELYQSLILNAYDFERIQTALSECRNSKIKKDEIHTMRQTIKNIIQTIQAEEI